MANVKRNVPLRMMAKYRFREAIFEDLPELSRLAHHIWREHYPKVIGLEQTEYMLKKWYNIESLTEQMREAGRQTMLVTHDEKMVGYIQYGPKDDAIFIHKVYLMKEHRGSGLAKQLFDQIDYRPLELRVNKDNAGSIAFYKRYGFEIIDENILDIGGGYVMDDYVMRCNS